MKTWTTTRTDWQLGIEGWKGREIVVIAGNDPDKNCLYHQLVGDAITYRYRFHAILPAPIPGEPPGINLSNLEWWQYIGLNERHNLAMAIKPYLEDRIAHWQFVYTPHGDGDSGGGTTIILSESSPAPATAGSDSAREGIGPNFDSPSCTPDLVRPRRTPDLDTSRDRLALVDALARELATIKQDLKRFCTAEDLKQKHPQFILWEHIDKAELKELADGAAFAPKAYAESLTLRKFGITSRETLKKDRKKFRQAQKLTRP